MPAVVKTPSVATTRSKPQTKSRVRPSIVDPASAQQFTLDQELKQFGNWVNQPIWVPPKGSSDKMAQSMLHHSSWFSSREKRWNGVVARHRDSFTQVREIELPKASIRLHLR